MCIKPIIQYFVENEQRLANITAKKRVGKPEIVLIIEYVEIFDYIPIGNVVSRETYKLIKDRKCIAQAAVTFLGYDVQSALLDVYILL